MVPHDLGPFQVPVSFDELLHQLAKQHKIEVQELQKENQLLLKELQCLRQLHSTSEDVPHTGAARDQVSGLDQGSQLRRQIHHPSFGCIVSVSDKDDRRFLPGALQEVQPGPLVGPPEPLSKVSRTLAPTRTADGLGAPSEVSLTPVEHEGSRGPRRRSTCPSFLDQGESHSLGRPMRVPAQHRTFVVSPELLESHDPLMFSSEKLGAETTNYTAILPAACLPGEINISNKDSCSEVPVPDPSPKYRLDMRRGSSLQLERAVSDLHSVHLKKQRVRFRHMLDLRGNVVYAEDLLKVVQKRGRPDYSLDRARSVIKQMQEVDQLLMESHPDCLRPAMSCESEVGEESGVFLHTFVQLVSMPDLWAKVSPEAFRELCTVRRLLLPKGADEVIAKVTKTQRSSSSLFVRDHDRAGEDTARRLKKLTILNFLVGICVVCSMVTLGLSTDFSPHWMGWLMLEIVFAVVFLAEVVVKISFVGWREYLVGWGWQWNVFDASITLLTLFDLSVSLATTAAGADTGISAAKLTLVLRAVRLTRIARLVKLLHTPILAGLANMLAGFLVGVPCMFWVMVLLTLVFYVLGVCFRLLVGPSWGNHPMEDCGGSADEIHSDEPGCQPHILYGQEYFGTLRRSMFTVFRCVLGDCASKAGRSLTAEFSDGYGFPFDLVYCGGMVLVVFGLFNIIAAIFVETTISGLKFNTIQRRYARLYESHYVQTKLENLVRRVQELHDVNHPTKEGEFKLTEEEFNEVMQDDKVGGLLEDLDVVLTNRVGLFDMFDCDNNGLVSVEEFVSTLMKVRGEPQKTDMIASWVALRSLNDRFQNFERLILENQKRMLEYQRDLATASPVSRIDVSHISKGDASPFSKVDESPVANQDSTRRLLS